MLCHRATSLHFITGYFILASLFPILAVLILGFFHYLNEDYVGAKNYDGQYRVETVQMFMMTKLILDGLLPISKAVTYTLLLVQKVLLFQTSKFCQAHGGCFKCSMRKKVKCRGVMRKHLQGTKQ